jgi:tRNA threonylcarbamoyladenosine biosynthesis protein TsaB
MLLAIDTSTEQIGIALGDGNQIAAEWMWQSQQYHTVELAPALDRLLRVAGQTMEGVEAISVAIGPGSYTALRVGLSLAKGIAVSRGIPIIGIPTLDVLAAAQPGMAMPLAAVLRAGRGRLALAWYRPASSSAGEESSARRNNEEGFWQAGGEAELTTVDALAKSIEKPTLVAGELTAAERQRLARKKVKVILAAPHLCVRRPSLLVEIGWRRLQSGQVDNAAALSPIYLHQAEPAPA